MYQLQKFRSHLNISGGQLVLAARSNLYAGRARLLESVAQVILMLLFC